MPGVPSVGGLRRFQAWLAGPFNKSVPPALTDISPGIVEDRETASWSALRSCQEWGTQAPSMGTVLVQYVGETLGACELGGGQARKRGTTGALGL